MKKIPVYLKILGPIFLLFLAAGLFFVIKFAGTSSMHKEKASEIEAIESEIPQTNKVDSSKSKTFRSYFEVSFESNVFDYDYSMLRANLEYKGVEFMSFSDEWSYSDLEELSQELFKNTHGDEINELDYVVVYDGRINDYPSIVTKDYEAFYYPLSLFEFLPEDYILEMWKQKNVVNVYNADLYNTIEKIAYPLSQAYGYYFMDYYFDIYGETADIVADPYFELRHNGQHRFYYVQSEFEDWDVYVNNYMWYLVEIAADDYVYIMGSPNTRNSFEYMDTYEILRLDAKDKEDEIEQYYALSNLGSFNEGPHINTVLPLPDQVEGLSELLYDVVNEKAPEYIDRSKEAEQIEIKVKRHTHYSKAYYKASWNKPWDDEDVTYTLVAYDKDDNLIGAIKTVYGDEKAEAIFGGAVVVTSSTDYSVNYTYYETDHWKNQGFLRLRVIATFSDGTAVISPPVDWSFE